MITLQNNHYTLILDDRTGAPVSLVDRLGVGEIIADARLAESFRLLLPLPELACHEIHGNAQAAPRIEATTETAILVWDGPLCSTEGEFDLAVTINITLAGDEIRVTSSVRNGTDRQIAEVWCPMFGGLRGLGPEPECSDTEALLPQVNSPWQQPLFRDFGNTRGETLGVTGVEHSFFYPGTMSMPWLCLYHPSLRRALTFAALEETPRVKLLRLALDPGTAATREDGNWPRPEEVGDQPFGLSMSWTHVPYTKPGETFESAVMVLRAHDGDWHEAAAWYRAWFEQHFPVVAPGATWMRREPACLDTMFLLPEDNINLTFARIPRWAELAKARGISYVMISGWHRGGHDRGYPYYEPDPRLGTWEELEDGVRACHDLGLKVSFFVNCQPIDMSTDWYKTELHRYNLLDPYGVPYYIVNYWGMGTLSARSRFFTARPFSEMNPAHPEVRELLIRQFRRLVEIGADGLHIDKFFNTPMDFNPRLAHTRPDRAHHEGILRFVEELLAACRTINPDFAFSYEGGWDRLMSYTDLSWWGYADDVLTAAFPQRALTGTVGQPYDYAGVNRALLAGSHLLVGPGNYTRLLDYPPMQPLLDYVAETIRIRRTVPHLLIQGHREDMSAGLPKQRTPRVRCAGSFAASPHAAWSLFRDPNTGQHALVLANTGQEPLRAEHITITGVDTPTCRCLRPFAPNCTLGMPADIEIPGERVVVLVPDDATD